MSTRSAVFRRWRFRSLGKPCSAAAWVTWSRDLEPAPMIATNCGPGADVFTDLVELQSKLGRDPSERPAPREPRHHAPQFLQRATTMAPRER